VKTVRVEHRVSGKKATGDLPIDARVTQEDGRSSPIYLIDAP
jgi:hypothetical protein